MAQSIISVLVNDQDFEGYVYLDATDEAVEGTWTDFDGNPLTYTKWGTGEPKTDVSTNYAAFVVFGVEGYDGNWYPSKDEMEFACQKKLTAGKS